MRLLLREATPAAASVQPPANTTRRTNSRCSGGHQLPRESLSDRLLTDQRLELCDHLTLGLGDPGVTSRLLADLARLRSRCPVGG
jgi:hypothetical protein